MKICNSCMQLTEPESAKCPVCKMSDFTPLDSSKAVRERQVKRIKKSQGIYRKPRRKVDKFRRQNQRSNQKPRIKSLAVLIAGSAGLSVILNSTVWSAPGNPLDLGQYSLFEARTFGLTPLTQDEFATMGTYIFKRGQVAFSSSIDGEPVVQLVVAYENRGTVPANKPNGDYCLKTNKRHLESNFHSGITWAYEPLTKPNPGAAGWNPEIDSQELLHEFLALNGYWILFPDEVPLEAYLGECGKEGSAWFRFKINKK